MKKTIFVLMLFFAAAAQAVPAYPELIQFRQPADGNTVWIYLKGDERVHWAETEDGYSLMHRNDGSLVYAMLDANGDMVASDYLATDKGQRTPEVEAFLRTMPHHIHYSKRQVDDLTKIWREVENAKSGPKYMTNVIGDKKFLLILFEFNDLHFSHSARQFDMLMNQVNYTAGGHTGSVRDYYHDVSGGLFTLSMDVVGPFTGTRNTAFYGNSDNGYQYFAREAVDSAAKYVDFSDYDNDGDGYIDGLHIIFAGYGEEAGASADHIWSHKWNIWDAPTYNNTVVDVYSCSPECSGNMGGNMTEIGVICHELGHVFGAPDYYDTDYGGSGGEYPGLGNWDIMSGGSWNCNGNTPAHHNPYTKIYIYHWATCDTLTNAPRHYVMDPVAVTNNEFHRVNTSTRGDFFLIENRQKIKWDNCIPGHGMLVYHVHPNANGADVSNYRHPQQIYILAKTHENQYPTNTPSSYGQLNQETATFPGGAARRDSLTDNSTPWFRPWSQQPNNIPFYNISDDPATGKLYFSIQNLSPDPLSATAEGIDSDKILLSWERYGTLRTFIIRSSNPSQFGTPSDTLHVGDTLADGSIVAYYGSGNSAVVPDLEQGAQYYFMIFTQRNDGTFSDGISVTGTTLNCTVAEWRHEDFESSMAGELPDCWTGDWRIGSIDGQQALISGNNPSSTNPYWRVATSRPILFDTIEPRVFQYSMKFMEGCDEQTHLRVEYQSTPDSEWVILDSITYSNESAAWDSRYMIVDDLGDYSRLRFALRTNGTESVAVDDIRFTEGWLIESRHEHGGEIEPFGYNVVGYGDSIEFIITPHPGYEVDRLKYDSRVLLLSRLTPRGDGSYSYKVSETGGTHRIIAEFKRNMGINYASETLYSVYPNPTSGKLTIECVAGSNIELYDTRGSLIMRQKATVNVNVIDMQELPKGIYILHCDKNVTKVVKK